MSKDSGNYDKEPPPTTRSRTLFFVLFSEPEESKRMGEKKKNISFFLKLHLHRNVSTRDNLYSRDKHFTRLVLFLNKWKILFTIFKMNLNWRQIRQ